MLDAEQIDKLKALLLSGHALKSGILGAKAYGLTQVELEKIGYTKAVLKKLVAKGHIQKSQISVMRRELRTFYFVER